VTDTTLKQDFFIDIRHDASYPFSNIYFFLDVSFPNGKRLRDTIACDLADEQGNWLGSGFGNLIDQRIGFRKATAFPITGDYRMDITHAMRLDPLPGVLDVGFRLERTPDPGS
jgi:gliding motility-associated lipoprotein GldH